MTPPESNVRDQDGGEVPHTDGKTPLHDQLENNKSPTKDNNSGSVQNGNDREGGTVVQTATAPNLSPAHPGGSSPRAARPISHPLQESTSPGTHQFSHKESPQAPPIPPPTTPDASNQVPSPNEYSTTMTDIVASPPTAVGDFLHQMEEVGEQTRQAIHVFFYPTRAPSRTTAVPAGSNSLNPQPSNPISTPSVKPQSSSSVNSQVSKVSAPQEAPSASRQDWDRPFEEQEREDQKYIERFWTTYDDIIILSLFTQVGIVFRLAAATWFYFFDGIFRTDSPLFVNLPLNCFSCFLMGLFCSGDRLMELIHTRFTPRKLQQQLRSDDEDLSNDGFDDNEYLHLHNDSSSANPRMDEAGLRQRRHKRAKEQNRQSFHSWQPPVHLYDDLREVQLLALERRIRQAKCLVLFKVQKEDADVMEHYFSDGYKRSQNDQWENDDNGYMYKGNNLDTSNHGIFSNVSGDSLSFDLELTDISRLDERAKYGEIDQHRDKTVSPQKSRLRPDAEDIATPVTKNSKVAALDPSFDGAIPVFPKLRVANSFDSPSQQSYNRPGESNEKDASQLTPTNSSEALPYEHKDDFQLSVNQSPSSERKVAFVSPDGAIRRPRRGRRNLPLPLGDEECPDHETNHETRSQSPLQSVSHEEADANIDQYISNVSANVTENISRMRRINIADGWDANTTPEAMADDLMLGLRDGFCGAVSSFSSWNSAMVSLLRAGHIGEAIIGYMLGLQLPIVAYRFGQHVAVYVFVWRCRQEAKSDENRGGYGIRVNMMADDDDEEDQSTTGGEKEHVGVDMMSRGGKSFDTLQDEVEKETPSIRAICTAMFVLSLVTQCTSLSFFTKPEDQQLALSLLFSPVGSLVRWRLSRYNNWRPGFPMGTFACNILACSLSGTLGSLLAGNPGPRERIFLVSFVAGFGGTLSSLATFIVEVLAGIDPLLFRFDGVIYAVSSIFWAMVVAFFFSASVDWADETNQKN